MMRCAEVTGANKPLRVVVQPRLKVPPGGLLVKTSYAGICHSDVHYIEDKLDLGLGRINRFSKPLGDKYVGSVIGHEVAGIIEEFGEDVNSKQYGLAKGDQVIVYPWWGCMKCSVCKSGFNNHCNNTKAGSINLGLGIYPGGYGTHVQVPSPDMVIKVPKSVPMHIACMIPCSGGTAFEALMKTRERLQYAYKARPNHPARLLIVSAGGLGLWAVRLASKAIPEIPLSITVVDIDETKLDIAMKAGADEAVMWATSGNQIKDVKKTTRNGLMDAAIDFVGKPYTAEVAIKCMEIGGTLILVGLGGGVLPLSIPIAIMRGISISGSIVLQLKTVKVLLDLLAKGGIKYDDVEFYKLDDINKALDKLRIGKVRGRAVIVHDDEHRIMAKM